MRTATFQRLEVFGIIVGGRIRKTTSGLSLVLNLEEARHAKKRAARKNMFYYDTIQLQAYRLPRRWYEGSV